MKHKLLVKRIISLILAMGVLSLVLCIPAFAEDTTAEPDAPDWSACYVTCYADGITNTRNPGTGIYSGCVVSSATATSTIVPTEFSFDSATGVLTCSGKSTAAYPSYLLLRGLDILNITVTAGSITVTESSDPGWSEYYFSTGVADTGASGGVRITTHSATELGVTIPDDVTWVQISSSSNAWYHFTLTVEPTPPPRPFDSIIAIVQMLFGGMLTIGTSLATWVSSTPLALISLILAVVFFMVAGSRKFFDGV